MKRKALYVTQTRRIMQLTALFLFVAGLTASATGFSQKVTLSEKNAPLTQVFRDIRQQTGYEFLYTDEMLRATGPVTLNLKNADLPAALASCFKDQPLTFSIIGRTIIVKPKPFPAPTIQAGDSSSPRLIDIHGRVVDDKGQPVPGVTVSVKGGKKATATDENGEFILKITDPNAVLVFTSVNMETSKLKFKGESELSVSLKPKAVQLGEVSVEVNTGYQKVSNERSTGSFAFVNNKQLNRKVSSDILSRLEGSVPGLLFNRNVNTINNPNGVDINIRGHNTILSNDQPLIVVDNFPFDGNINNINPNDIESVSILKDAAAASIWGVKSGNGVIVITTKSGKRNQKTLIQFNVNTSIGAKPNLFYDRNFLNSPSFIDIEETLFSQGYYDSQIGDPTQLISPVVQILANERAGTLSSSDATSQINAYSKIDYRNDLNKYFYQNSLDQQYNINLRGGGQNSDFFFSAGYDNNNANQIGNKNNRVTVNSLNNFLLSKNLTFSAGLNYMQTKGTNNSPIANINPGNKSLYPYAELVDPNGKSLSILKGYNYSWITDSISQNGLINWEFKPLDELRYSDNVSTNIESRLNFGLTYKLLQYFDIDAKYQYEQAITTNQNYYSDSTYYTRNLINLFTNLTGSPQYPIPIGGILNKSVDNLQSHHARVQLNYSRQWDQKNELKALVGSELNQTITSDESNTVYGYDQGTGAYQNVDFVDYFPTLPLGSYEKIPTNLGFAKTTDRYISYFTNVGYTYKSRYTLTLSGRIDKSNLFGVTTNQKSIPLYSAGFAWEISKEAFYNLPMLTYLRFRSTFGYNGNIYKGVAAVTTIATGSQNYFSNDLNASIQTNGNPKLRWEKDRMINLGFDFAFKNQIVYGSVEYYHKDGIDLFGTSPLPPSTGFTSFTGNTANTSGNGIDLIVNTKNIKSKYFSWETNFIFSYVLDKVSKYDDTTSSTNYIQFGDNNSGFGSTIYPLSGKPLFAIYSYKFAGLEHSTGDPQGFINGHISKDWTNIILNTTTQNINFNGPSRPPFFGSLQNNFFYKNISLSLNLIYKVGYYFRRSSISYSGLFAGWNGNADYTRRWQNPGDETKTNVPSVQYPPNDNNRDLFYQYSSALIDKGDHIRIQDVRLSYDLDMHSGFKSSFAKAQLFIYVNNLGILWRANQDHLDPDLYTNQLPIPRTYSFGISLTL